MSTKNATGVSRNRGNAKGAIVGKGEFEPRRVFYDYFAKEGRKDYRSIPSVSSSSSWQNSDTNGYSFDIASRRTEQRVRVEASEDMESGASDAKPIENTSATVTATETATRSRRARVRVPSVKLPATWTALEPYETWRQVLVNTWDADYPEARSRFTLTLGGQRALLGIYRIQNPALLSRFLSQKASMERRYAGRWPKMCGMESRLYHGAEESAVAHIGANGFDTRDSDGRNVMDLQYGAGVYFTRDMRYWTEQESSPTISPAGQKSAL